MCGAWETQFDTDHTSIIQFTDRYYKPRSTTSTASKSQLSAISSNKTSTVNALAEIAAKLKSEMLKMSAESNERLEARLFQSNAELDKKIQASNTATIEEFFKRFDAQLSSKIGSSRVNTLKSVNEQVTQQLKTLSEEIAAPNQSTQVTFDEIANDTAVLRETVTSMKDEISKQVKTSKKKLCKLK
jgi:CRP-like cAMP-binding protein